MDGNCVTSLVKLLYLGILYHFIGAEKIFVWFFLSLHRWKNFWPTKLYRFIWFFSQKLCICIALSIHFWVSLPISVCKHNCRPSQAKITTLASYLSDTRCHMSGASAVWAAYIREGGGGTLIFTSNGRTSPFKIFIHMDMLLFGSWPKKKMLVYFVALFIR